MSHVDTITLPEPLYVAVQINDGHSGGLPVSRITANRSEVEQAARVASIRTPGWRVVVFESNGLGYRVSREEIAKDKDSDP